MNTYLLKFLLSLFTIVKTYKHYIYLLFLTIMFIYFKRINLPKHQ